MKKFISGLIGIAILVLPVVVLAQAPTVDLMTALGKVADILFNILIAVAAVFIVWAGISFVTAGGDAEKVEKARSMIMYAVIGIIVAILAKGIVAFIKGQFI